MSRTQRLKTIAGPNGRPLTLGDLPPVKPNRWFPAHKANVVAAVGGGLITAEQACKRYKLTIEEFTLWQRAFEAHGIAGLRVARAKRSQKSASGLQTKV
jgi:Protein of unknown function (DUF1153)